MEWNCSGFYSSREKETILVAIGTTGLLSVSLCIIGASFVFWFKLHKEFAYRLAFYQVMMSMQISIVMMLATVPIIGTSHNYRALCQASGFLLEYFMWVKLLFALCLIFHLFCLTVFLKNFENLELCYIAWCLGFPVLFTWVPFLGHTSYGLTESWCWIVDTRCNATRYMKGFIEQYTLWFGPLATCIIVSFVAIVVIIAVFKYRYNKLSSMSSSEEDHILDGRMKKYILRVYFRKLLPLLVYPALYFVLFLFPLLRQLHHSLSSHENFWAALAHSISYTSVGFVSSFILILHVFSVRRLKSWSEYFFPEHEASATEGIASVASDLPSGKNNQ